MVNFLKMVISLRKDSSLIPRTYRIGYKAFYETNVFNKIRIKTKFQNYNL